MKERIHQLIDEMQTELNEIRLFVGSHPELGHREFQASKLLGDTLEKYGFQVTYGISGLATAFEAVYDSGTRGPSVGFLAEYDALPEIGHACGHNLICTMALGAGAALSKVIKGGKVYVYGTPAEETAGGKVTMTEAGVFNHLDCVLMAHPSDSYLKSGSTLAIDALQFVFYGKAAHASAAPHEGINALDAVLQTFNSVNALRQHVTSDVRIHGIVKEGGKAANIVPDYAVAQFYVRAKSRSYLNEVVQKMKACAEGAALATGARLEISNYELSYDNLRTNETLSQAFTDNLVALGVRPEEIKAETGGYGSSDIGNVSQAVPAIHPHIKISNSPCPAHTIEFREHALGETGLQSLLIGAKCLADTGYDILTKPELVNAVKKEFKKQNGR